ncbi:hypothetical protein Pmar_PMAR018811 [Perkinsus marinus ATCC 50983]|uniref:EF-hand domain-containing protein n=2 Tax=Perkinsus marinus (strain ATCC 50983 / TXsc) TaxID=423536 RepID=C5KJF4_PERM5|nr:hypothetical protein Pmar_PMAR018811 [Perkinsus marinus ATCC 50983]EER15456.1 hypothetical protein Pmar_PMAR018811 [Perkinsus marinus ATCC 50983]|eukprot:XP_002783660.1 hypothetical protein Pmar_PMAR018811 [Perkinsus marinus ATCC 50983]
MDTPKPTTIECSSEWNDLGRLKVRPVESVTAGLWIPEDWAYPGVASPLPKVVILLRFRVHGIRNAADWLEQMCHTGEALVWLSVVEAKTTLGEWRQSICGDCEEWNDFKMEEGLVMTIVRSKPPHVVDVDPRLRIAVGVGEDQESTAMRAECGLGLEDLLERLKREEVPTVALSMVLRPPNPTVGDGRPFILVGLGEEQLPRVFISVDMRIIRPSDEEVGSDELTRFADSMKHISWVVGRGKAIVLREETVSLSERKRREEVDMEIDAEGLRKIWEKYCKVTKNEKESRRRSADDFLSGAGIYIFQGRDGEGYSHHATAAAPVPSEVGSAIDDTLMKESHMVEQRRHERSSLRAGHSGSVELTILARSVEEAFTKLGFPPGGPALSRARFVAILEKLCADTNSARVVRYDLFKAEVRPLLPFSEAEIVKYREAFEDCDHEHTGRVNLTELRLLLKDIIASFADVTENEHECTEGADRDDFSREVFGDGLESAIGDNDGDADFASFLILARRMKMGYNPVTLSCVGTLLNLALV